MVLGCTTSLEMYGSGVGIIRALPSKTPRELRVVAIKYAEAVDGTRAHRIPDERAEAGVTHLNEAQIKCFELLGKWAQTQDNCARWS